MASGSSNYNRGDMKIDAQGRTFNGFMGGTVYGGVVVALVVIMPTLIFGVGLGWLPALIATFVVGVLCGVALKLKGGFYVGLVAVSILVAIACALLSLAAA